MGNRIRTAALLCTAVLFTIPVYGDEVTGITDNAAQSTSVTAGAVEESSAGTAVQISCSIDIPEGTELNQTMFLFIRDLRTGEVHPLFLYGEDGYTETTILEGSGYYAVYAGDYGWMDKNGDMWAINGNTDAYYYCGETASFDASAYSVDFTQSTDITVSVEMYDLERITERDNYAMNAIKKTFETGEKEVAYSEKDLVQDITPETVEETSETEDVPEKTGDNAAETATAEKKNPFKRFLDEIVGMVTGHIFLIAGIFVVALLLRLVQAKKESEKAKAERKNMADKDIVD